MDDDDAFRTVNPAHPPAPYIGGKKQLAARLVQLIEAIPHQTYAEPFVGMGGVFLRRRRAPKVEVINDISGDVVTLFRILQRHYVPLMDMLRFQLTSRREFERLCNVDAATLTDLERAARFLYVQRVAFGGKVTNRSFGFSQGTPGRFDVSKLGPQLAELNERLAGVIIENLPYAEFVARYDAPDVLFYLDPPYAGSETDYGRGVFGALDFHRLAQLLAELRGTFILSINDTPEIRRIFARFEQKAVEIPYSIAEGDATVGRELIIAAVGVLDRAEKQGRLFGD